MFVGETISAFQLDDEYIFYKDICEVLSHTVTLVSYRKRYFTSSPDAPKTELVEQRTLINLLKKSRTQSIRDRENRSEHSSNLQSIRLYQCSSAAY